MLKHIDRRLGRDRVPIHVRHLKAIREVARNLGNIELPVFGSTVIAAELPNAWISRAVEQWYAQRYSDRLKMDHSLGRVAILLRGDVWTIQVPLAFGTIQGFSQRERTQTPFRKNEPALCNVVDSIDGLPEGVRSSLSDEELRDLREKFLLGYLAFRDFLQIGDKKLLLAARSDQRTAVSQLIARRPDYGQSKWHSSQATEKTLKAFIAGKGRQFSKKNHKLEIPANDAEAAGLPLIDRALLSRIQCDAGVALMKSLHEKSI